jgi:predicted RNase H-like nuclease (RuvC/YqgF family)
MNALSKVLIVLVLVLSVGFAVSQMVLFGKREDYGKAYMDEADARARTVEKLEKTEAALEDLRVEFGQLKESKDTRIQGLEQELANAQEASRDLQTQNTNLTTNVTTLTDRANKLEGDIATLEQTNDGLRGEIEQRDDTIADQLDKIDSLETTVAEREGTIGDLEHELTELKKDYHELALSEERLQAIVGELVERGVHVPPAPLPIINGRVVRVDLEHGVAVVDKGSDAGVQPNTQFTVYDDGGYLAKLVIHDVQPDVSAGRIRLLVENRTVKQGDKVTTEVP